MEAARPATLNWSVLEGVLSLLLTIELIPQPSIDTALKRSLAETEPMQVKVSGRGRLTCILHVILDGY